MRSARFVALLGLQPPEQRGQLQWPVSSAPGWGCKAADGGGYGARGAGAGTPASLASRSPQRAARAASLCWFRRWKPLFHIVRDGRLSGIEHRPQANRGNILQLVRRLPITPSPKVTWSQLHGVRGVHMPWSRPETLNEGKWISESRCNTAVLTVNAGGGLRAAFCA